MQDPSTPISSSVASEPQKSQGFSVWFVLTRCLGLFLVAIGPLATLSFPKLIENSDYVSAFYAAGAAVAKGHSNVLYPRGTERSFNDVAFNHFAHGLLPNLSPNNIPIYMYSPANAILYAPLTIVNPQLSMIIWQVLSIIAVVLSAALIAKSLPLRRSVGDLAFCSFLFLPVFHTIVIGQLGILWGLLPLCIGIFFMQRKRDILAGLSWSLFLLKPQFLPAALIIAGAQLMNRRWQMSAGLLVGAAVIVGGAGAVLGFGSWVDWVNSIRLTDNFYNDPGYQVQTRMIACWPAALMSLVPIDARSTVKLASYVLAAAVGLHALWISVRLLKKSDCVTAQSYVLLIALLILPFVVPHLHFYDLCILSACGYIVFCNTWQKAEQFDLYALSIISLLCLNIYYLLSVSPLQWLAQPLVLVILLAAVYIKVLRLSGQCIADQAQTADVGKCPD